MDIKALVQRLLRETGYLLMGFPLATLFFVLTVTGVALGGATSIIWIGLPILGATLMMVGGFVQTERRSSATLANREITGARYETGPDGIKGLLTPITDPQRWFDVLWVLAHFVCSIFTFTITAALWAGSLWVVLGPPIELVLYLADLRETPMGLPTWLANSLEYLAAIACLLLLPWGVHGLATLQSSLSQQLLGSRAHYQAQVEHLHRSREAAHDAEARSLHRLERDIHDGPQQRLIRLQMDLARVERAAENNPERARELLAEARQQTSETLAELRNLSRGIAPPVLQDRGLAAALDELAARSEILCVADVQGICGVPGEGGICPDCGGHRMPLHLLSAAYFVAAEAITNANKHSVGTRIDVDVTCDGAHLIISVLDDGIGGASLAKGHGLAGLERRLQGVDATLDIDSPQGGPTRVQAVIPCTS